MHRSRLIVYLSVLLVLAWAALAFADLKPAHYPAYRRTAVQVAESAYDAARTGWLAGTEVLSGQAFPTFASTAFDDATKALAGANAQFASEAPPNAPSRRLRDQLGPLLAAAVVLLGDASAAEDDAALRAAVQGLDKLAGKLDDFIEAYR